MAAQTPDERQVWRTANAVALIEAVLLITILISGILDGLDGRVARLTGSSSKFGVEYDSLADVIAFGLSPRAC